MAAEPDVAAALRLFFALWPPPDVARRLHAAAQELHGVCCGRLMRQDSLHVTLAFLGDVPADRVVAAEAAAAGVAGVAAAGFAFELDRLGYWKHNRILWAGSAAVSAGLNALAGRLAEKLRAAGFELEARPFAAHATLSRNVVAVPAKLPPLAPIAWPVADFALVASRSTDAGSRYEVRRRWALAAPIV